MPLLRIVAVCLLATFPAVAQRGAPNVTFGHIHINSADPDKTIAFWTDIIGISTWSRDSLKGVSTLGVLILITRSAPSGPSAGSAIDHIGFKVPDLQPFIGKLAKTSYKSFQPAGDQLMIDGPDGVRIELAEESSLYGPLQLNHIHLNPTRSHTAAAGLPFAHADSVSPTARRAIDHIAFEIKNLESFCQKLAADGI